MNELHHRFHRSIRWNTIEALGYHTLFIGHQIALFRYVDKSLYGKMGTLFAMIYAVIALANLGLDFSLAPLFNEIKASKESVKKILLPQCIIQIAIVIGVGAIFFLYTPLTNQPLIYCLVIMIMIIESIRKTMRIILQLLFLNHITSITEITFLLVYVASTWLLFFFYEEFSLPIILVPFVFCYTTSIGVMAYFLHEEYKNLSSNPILIDIFLLKRIVQLRASTALYTLGHQLFSSNILLPWIALHSGFVQAGVWQLITSITYTITSVVHKIGGFATQALLATIKAAAPTTKKEAFSLVSMQLHHVIYTIVIVMSINYKKILLMNMQSEQLPNWLLAAYIYLGITIVEQLSLSYEKFYINEEAIHYLIISHCCTIALCIGLMSQQSLSITMLLIALFSIRIISFLVLAIVAYIFWGIAPHLRIKLWFSLLITGISLIIYMLL